MIIQLYKDGHENPAYWINLSNYAQTEILHYFGPGNSKKIQAPGYAQKFIPLELAKAVAELLGAPNPEENRENLQKLIHFPIRKIYGPGLMQLSNNVLIAVKVIDVEKIS